MTFRTYPAPNQVWLTEAIRATVTQHQATPLHLWRTALEQVNPEVITVAPYCMASALGAVYAWLNVATNT